MMKTRSTWESSHCIEPNIEIIIIHKRNIRDEEGCKCERSNNVVVIMVMWDYQWVGNPTYQRIMFAAYLFIE